MDLGAAEHVTYVLRQSFRYDYDGPAADLRHRLVVVPRARHGSLRRRVSDVRVSAPEAVVRRRRDRHGNPVVDVRLALVPAFVEFAMDAVLVRSGGYQDAQVGPDACPAPAHLRPSALTAPDSALRDLAGELRRESSDDLDLAERCCTRVHGLIAYQYGVTTTATTAAEALALGRGVCQDHAHVMIAICRAAGVPARYVSGHLLGEGGTHAWVEVLVLTAPAVALERLLSTRATAAGRGCVTSRSRSVATTPTWPPPRGTSQVSPGLAHDPEAPGRNGRRLSRSSGIGHCARATGSPCWGPVIDDACVDTFSDGL